MLVKKTVTDPKQLGLMTQSFFCDPTIRHWEAVFDAQTGKNTDPSNMEQYFLGILETCFIDCNKVVTIVDLPLLFIS